MILSINIRGSEPGSYADQLMDYRTRCCSAIAIMPWNEDLETSGMHKDLTEFNIYEKANR